MGLRVQKRREMAGARAPHRRSAAMVEEHRPQRARQDDLEAVVALGALLDGRLGSFRPAPSGICWEMQPCLVPGLSTRSVVDSVKHDWRGGCLMQCAIHLRLTCP